MGLEYIGGGGGRQQKMVSQVPCPCQPCSGPNIGNDCLTILEIGFGVQGLGFRRVELMLESKAIVRVCQVFSGSCSHFGCFFRLRTRCSAQRCSGSVCQGRQP